MKWLLDPPGSGLSGFRVPSKHGLCSSLVQRAPTVLDVTAWPPKICIRFLDRHRDSKEDPSAQPRWYQRIGVPRGFPRVELCFNHLVDLVA